MADEWRYLCRTALSFGRVERELRIFSSVSRLVQEGGEAAETLAAGERDEMQTTGEQGDAGVHGFWLMCVLLILMHGRLEVGITQRFCSA